MQMEKPLWEYKIEEIVAGYAKTDRCCTCVICGTQYEVGGIYQLEDGRIYDAERAVKRHVEQVHGPRADWLLDQEPGLLGITEKQLLVLRYLHEGYQDAEVAQLCGVSLSTVHKYYAKLQEKACQAKLYLALVNALGEETKQRFGIGWSMLWEEVPTGAIRTDARCSITAAEREMAIKAYFDENGALKQIPAKEKKKIIVLYEIMKNFNPNQAYSEKEVNGVLARIYPDYAALRRALIEYRFMERTPDGSVYRATTNTEI